jgi:hypothetical protein
VLPALLLAASAVIQAMLYFHAAQSARAAANQGLTAAQGFSGSAAAGRARAAAVLDQLGHPLGGATVSASRTGTRTRVTVAGQAPRLLPVIDLSVRGVAAGTTTRFRR